jgi:hypothetical protein
MVQDFAPVLPHHHGIGVPKLAEIRIIDSRLATEGHTLAQHGLVALGDPGRLVAFQTDAVPGPVAKNRKAFARPNEPADPVTPSPAAPPNVRRNSRRSVKFLSGVLS